MHDGDFPHGRAGNETAPVQEVHKAFPFGQHSIDQPTSCVWVELSQVVVGAPKLTQCRC